MKRLLRYTILCSLLFTVAGCMKWDYGYTEEFHCTESGLFIVNEGNFQYGNATLSFYDPQVRSVKNEIFYRANAMKLGDQAQSMTIHNGTGWIVVGNSHVVFAIDPDTFREKGRITNLTSPRYIHFISDDKAYITQLWDNRIFIINPKRYEVTGYIECPDMTPETGSTEQMVQKGEYLYVNCWSYQNRLLKIDTASDTIVAELEVGIQPSSLALDRNGKLWTITDGGYEGSPYGEEVPALIRIDPDTFTIEQRFEMPSADRPSELQTDGTGGTLYWIDTHIWSMDIDASSLPTRPLIPADGMLWYGLTTDPERGDIYAADAADYMQQGTIKRYSSDGELLDSFLAGVTPGAFCWKQTSGK
ncbi:MAG: YncE family protein [Alistipes sp.]|nr:YncE family protein [Alistipes sp.]